MAMVKGLCPPHRQLQMTKNIFDQFSSILSLNEFEQAEFIAF